MLSAFFKSILCSETRDKISEEVCPDPIEALSYDAPPTQGKFLVLDLDETLIHARDRKFCPSNLTINFCMSGRKTRCYATQRPYLKEFLDEMSQLYSIVVFTASPREYAEHAIKVFGIDKYIQKLFHREDCRENWSGLTKDLTILGVPLKDIILIDDNLANSYYQPDNIILISRFEGQVDDKVLYDLIPFLKRQHSLYDLRKVDNRYVAYMKELRAKKQKKLEEKQDAERQDAIGRRISQAVEKTLLDSQSTGYTTDSSDEKAEGTSMDSSIGGKLENCVKRNLHLSVFA